MGASLLWFDPCLLIMANIDLTDSPEKYKSLDKIWQVNLGSAVYSDITSADIDGDGAPEVIIVTSDDTLFVLDHSGNLLWKFETEKKGSVEDLFLDKESIKLKASSPVVYDINGDGKQEIIFGCENSRLYILSNKGEKLFEFKAEGPIRSTAAVADINNDGKPEIVVGSNDNNLYILDSEAKLLRKLKVGGEIESGIVLDDVNQDGTVNIIFCCDDNHLYVLDSDGGLVWKYQTGGPVKATPTIASLNDDVDKFVVFGSDDGKLYIVRSNGSLQTSYETSGRIVSKVAVSDINGDSKEEIIASSCSYENNIVILSRDASLINSFSAGFWVASSPVLFGRQSLVFGSYDHRLYVVDLSRSIPGSPLSNVRIFDTGDIIVSTPVVVDAGGHSIIVAGNNKGDIFGIRYG